MASSAKSLSALLAQASLDDDDEILKAANATIKKSKADLDAHHAKAVALLKLDRYDDAAKLFRDVPKLQDRARFEYAYALYKSGEAGQAVEVAQEDASTRAMKHVLAQAVRISFCWSWSYSDANEDRHTGQRSSSMPQTSTRSLPGNGTRTRRLISGSTPSLSMPSWSGLGSHTWCSRGSLRGKISWRLRRHTTLPAPAFRGASWSRQMYA